MDPITLGLMALKFAPAVAGWIGGKDAKETAEKVVGIAESVTGLKGDVAVEALSKDPDLAYKFEELCVKERTDELNAHIGNTKDARAMQKELAKAGHGTAWASSLVSLIIVIGFFVVLYMVFNDTLEPGNEKIAYILIGTLGAGFSQVINYWLGSSKGSKDKTEHLAKLG